MGHHRHRRVPQRRCPWQRGRPVAPRPAGPHAGHPLRHPDPAVGHAARWLGAQLRLADEPAGPHRHLRPGRLHARRTSATRAWSSAASRRTSATRSAPTSRSASPSLRQPASPQEEAAYRALLDIPFTQRGQHQRGQAAGAAARRHAEGPVLQPGCRAGVHRSDASLCCKAKPTISGRRAGRGRRASRTSPTALRHDRRRQLQQVPAPGRSTSRARVRLAADDAADRLVIFSERIETLRWLQEHLPRRPRTQARPDSKSCTAA